MSGLPIAFGSPWWLLLLLGIPVIFVLTHRSLSGLPRGRRYFAIGLRTLVLLLVVSALAEMRFLKDNDRLAVIFVADLSESIPAAQREAERAYMVAKARERSQAEDLVGVVTFGKVPGIEWSPKDAPLQLESFTTIIEPQATDIAAGIRLAAAAFPDDYGKRIVLLTDGNQNRGDVVEEIYNARAMGITVDVVPITYAYGAEISVDKILVEPEQHVGEPFDLRVVVESTKETQAELQLFQNGQMVPQENPIVELSPGRNVFDFTGRRVDSVGPVNFEARIDPVNAADDNVFQNNAAAGFTFVGGEPKVLLCSNDADGDAGLLRALREENITVDVVPPVGLPGEIQDYLQYDGIIVSNVAATRLSDATMKMFESLVKTVGLGFVMIGGDESFGAGAYKGTPVERLLPVEMDVKNKKIMPNGAIAFVVHSCELGNGNLWARRVIQRGIQILSPRDFAGVISYEAGTDRWLFPMWSVARRREMLSLLRGFNPGDMPSFLNIVDMAYKGLRATTASIRHMVILTDGDPTPPTTQTVSQIRAAGITISTIVYGSHGVSPVAMKQLAAQGGGNFHMLQGPDQLPEIFIRETTTITKSLINEETFTPIKQHGHPILTGVGDAGMPSLDGYVLTSPKSLATVPIVHPPVPEDPTLDPILAAWNYGLGKAVAFTSDSGHRWGQGWVSWSQYRQFWGQCVRWTMRSRSDDRFRVTRSIAGATAKLHIDALTPDGRFINGLDIQGTVVSPDYESTGITVRQTAPGSYEASFPIAKKGTYTVTLAYERDGVRQSYVTGVSVPYSAEYRKLATNHDLLTKIAAAGEGRYIADVEGAEFFSRDFPKTRDVQDVWDALLIFAVCFFFVDVFVRRVTIDYRRAIARGWERVLAVLMFRRLEPAPTDARLATLLERKAKLREATESRYRAAEERAARGETVVRPAKDGTTGPRVARPASPPAGADDASSEEAARAADETLAAFSGRPSSSAGKSDDAAKADGAKPEAEEKKPPEPSGGAYTARLLEAKKRALKDKEDQGDR